MLLLNKSSYETLGLPGSPTHFSKHGTQKHSEFIYFLHFVFVMILLLVSPSVVQIDFFQTSFKPGKPLFEKVKSSLDCCQSLRGNFLVSWVPHGEWFVLQIAFIDLLFQDDKICGSSIEAFFKSIGFKVTQSRLTISESNDPCLTPLISYPAPDGHDSCDAFSVLDWLGAMACGVDQ
jgi:hypothetical protein